jgi:hypothetical protein
MTLLGTATKSGAGAMHTFYWTMRAELGAPQMRIRTAYCATCDWHSLRQTIEEAIGLRRGALSGGKRVDATVSADVLVRGRVIANCHSSADVSLGNEERAERLASLPYLEQAAALDDGDVVVIERIPPNLDVMEKLSIAGYSSRRTGLVSNNSNIRVPSHLQRLLRRRTTRIVYKNANEEEDNPAQKSVEISAKNPILLFGANNEAGAASTAEEQPLVLSNDLSELQRIEAIVQHAATQGAQTSAITTGLDEAIRHKKRRFGDENSVGNGDEEANQGNYRHHNNLHESIRYDQQPPQNYVCRRCGIAGHWLRHCPTHGNRDFDRARALSTNGIPKALLKPIDTAPDDADAVYYIDQTGKLFAMRDIDDPERIRFDRARAVAVEQAMFFPTRR